ncbi:MAG: tetratricopeptide repeat protein [Holophagaceae bacterium]|nr:tetratricopeptide repeat protein [Holophagaceae bacterium]
MARPWLRLLDPDLFALRASLGPDAISRLRYAKALNSRSLHVEAAEVLDRILAEERANGEAWFERILCEGDHSTDEELQRLSVELKAVRDEHPGEATPLRNLAFLRIIENQLDEAEALIEKAMAKDDQDAKTFELMGLLALHQDHLEPAKGALLKALSLQPKNPVALRMLGIVCEQMGDHPAAEAQALASLELDPNYYWGWHTLGEFLLQRGASQEGMRCVHRARSLNITEPSSYFLVAEIFAEQGQLDMAQAELHKLILLAPPASTFSEAQSLLGEFKRDLGDRDGAISYFTMAADTDPSAANPWAALGEMAREDERWEDALRCYQEALARDPEAADLQVQLGYTILETGTVKEAEHTFCKALEADPSEYSAYLGLSECARKAQRPEDQLRMVKEAMTLAPDDPDVWNANGVALEVAHRLPEATKAYNKALSLDPHHRKAANNLGFLLEKRISQGETGLKDQVINAWKRRLLICRDEGQSMRMATEHLSKLGIPDETLDAWISKEEVPVAVEN